MAVEVATAYVNVIPSARGFGRELSRQLGAEMGRAGADAGDAASAGFGSRLTSGIAAAAKAAAIGLGALGAAAAGWGLKVAAENEQASISFETLLGSAEKAQALLGDLKKFAAETPFEFPELQKAASSLLTTGVSADKIIPIMRTLGDVTSGMGTGSEGVKRATVALQQMNAAGRILGQDLNQLRDAGIPVFDLLAGATGKTKEELAAMAQNGKLGRKELDQLMAALESGKGLEKFNGLMEKQSASLKGIVSTLKDTLGQGLSDAMAPAIGPIKDSLKGLSAGLQDSLKVIGPVMSEAVVSLVNIGTKLVAAVMPLLGTFLGLFSSVLNQLAPVVEAITPLIVILADEWTNALRELMPELGGLLMALVPLIDPIVALAVTIGQGLAVALSAAMRALLPVVTALVGALAPSIQRIAELVPTVVDAFLPMVPVLQRLLAALVPVGAALIDGVLRVVEALVPELPGLVEAMLPLVDVFTDLILAVTPFIPQLVELALLLTPLIAEVLKFTAGLLGNREIMDTVVPVLLIAYGVFQLFTFIMGPLAAAIGVVTGAVSALGAALLANPIGLIIAAVALLVIGLVLLYQKWEPFRNLIDGLVVQLQAVVGWFGEFFSALFSWDTEKLLGMLAGVGDAITTWLTGTLIPFIAEKGPELLSALWGWLSSAVPELLGKLAGLLAGFAVWYYTVAIPWLVEQGLKLLGAFIGWVAEAVPAVLSKLGEWLGSIGAWILETAVPWLISKGASLLVAMLLWAVKLTVEMPMYLAKLLVLIGEWLVAAVPWLIEKAMALRDAITQWLIDAALALPGILLGFADTLLGFINSLPDRIATAAKDMFVGLANAFLAAFNWIVRTWNDFQLSVPEIEILGQKVGGFTLDTPNLSELPYISGFAKGGRPPTDKPSLVGELGPELFWPDKAGTVVPNDALAPGNAGLNIGHLEVTGQDQPAETAFALRSELHYLSMLAGAA